MDKLFDRFFSYISVDTQSKSTSRQTPSSEGQRKLANQIKQELTALGLTQINLTEQGYLMATLPANVDWKVPTIGFIAHLDTSPDFSGKQVTPQLIENYRGGDIALGIGDEVLSPIMFPVLHQLLGYSLITTDGKTLLGADDKAGIAEIITAMSYLKQHNIPHGDIRIAFTPDEEIGRGAQHFDVPCFDADWAYTVDGGGIGELEYENFNAARAIIKISGNNVHPGTAKDVMVNALQLVTQFHQQLPIEETPENTEGYQGFFHLTEIKGNVEYAEMHYLIRDFTQDGFEARKRKLIDLAKLLGNKLNKNCYIEVDITDTYYNMKEHIVKHPHIVELAKQAMLDCEITPVIKPIRGGTDGAQLSFKGLPCPNLFTGGYNYHSKHEFITVEGMEKAVQVIARIAELTALKTKPRT